MKKKAILIGVLLVLLGIILTGCALPAVLFEKCEGYVIDFVTKETISGAIISDGENTYETDEEGYFYFKGEQLVSCTAPGYEKREDIYLHPFDINTISLIKPYNSIYGHSNLENRQFRLEVIGEYDDFTATAHTDENGDFYLLNMPLYMNLDIWIYEDDFKYPNKITVYFDDIFKKSYYFEIDAYDLRLD